MDKKTEKYLIWGGVILGGYAILSSSKVTSLISPGTVTNAAGNTVKVPSDTPANAVAPLTAALKAYTGDPAHAPVATYAQAYAQNPNEGDPNYNLTDQEANQLIANYLDIRQVLDPPSAEQARLWWKKYGPADKRVFVPLVPPNMVGFQGDPRLIDYDGKRDGVLNHPTSSGSSSSWVGSALSIASTLIGFLGTGEQLNAAELEVLFMGGALAQDILPMYNTPNAKLAIDKLNALLVENI